MGEGDLLGDVEAEAGAPGAAAGMRKNLSKTAVWYCLGMPGPVSWTSMIVAAPFGSPRRPRTDDGPTGGRVADGVADQVGEHQLHPFRVDVDLAEAGEDLGLERDVLVARRAAEGSTASRTSDSTLTWRRCSSIRPDWMRDRSSRSSTICCSRSVSCRAACIRSSCLSLSAPTLSSAMRCTAMRREVSGVPELVRHGGDQIVLQLVEAEHPGHVLQDDGDAHQPPLLGGDARRAGQQEDVVSVVPRGETRSASSKPAGA